MFSLPGPVHHEINQSRVFLTRVFLLDKDGAGESVPE